jgi:outer membrane protein assembly factor BamB
MALHSRRSFLGLVGTVAGCADVAFADGTTTTATNATTTTRSGTTPSSTEAEASPTPDADETPPPVGDVRMDGVTPARTGHDPDAQGPGGPVQRQWCVGAGGSNRLTPLAVVDGTVFSGSPAKGVRAFDARTGETVWRARVDQYPNAPAVVGDRVYTTDAVAAYALGIESGRELWSTKLVDGGGRVTTSPLVASVDGDDVAFVGALERADDGETERGYVAAIDAADGSVRWRAETAGGNVYGSLAARGGVVYGGGTGHDFYAVDAATGERRWRAELGEHATSPAVGPESVVVGDEAGTVHARDRATGSERWTYETGGEVRASPAIADGTAYVAATDGDLYALDARTGDLQWRFDGGRRLTEAPTIVGGDDATVFVGSEQGNVFAVDAATGEPRWSHQLADDAETPPVVVDGFVFVGDGEGHVYALVEESASVPDGARQCDAGRTPTPTPEPATSDTDNDGVPDRRDYAPRDASVQRRGDIASGEGGDDEFLSGVAVGSAVTTVGVVSGWLVKGRTGDDE